MLAASGGGGGGGTIISSMGVQDFPSGPVHSLYLLISTLSESGERTNGSITAELTQ